MADRGRGGVPSASIVALLAAGLCAAVGVGTSANGGDPALEFQWLEEIQGERALAWVKARNAETVGRLEEDPRFDQIKSRLAQVPQWGSRVYTLSDGLAHRVASDAAHPEGMWQIALVGDLGRKPDPWQPVLDLGELSRRESQAWRLTRFYGLNEDPQCLPGGASRCLVRLSPGGQDVLALREFDLQKRQFVPGGFRIDKLARTYAAWLSRDEVLVSTDFGGTSIGPAGYAREVRLWRRGQALEDARVVLAPRDETIVTLPAVFHRNGRRYAFVAAARGLEDWDIWQVSDVGEARKLDLPRYLAWPGVYGVVDNRLVLYIQKDSDYHGRRIPGGSLVTYSLDRKTGGAERLEVVFEPAERHVLASLFAVAVTPTYLWYATLEDVNFRLTRATLARGSWRREPVEIPRFVSAFLIGVDPHRDDVILSTEGFLSPPRAYVMTKDGGRRQIEAATDLFDASGFMVEQKSASSKDGTKVPYFLVRRKNLEFDGESSTVLLGYGGFMVAATPGYIGPLAGGEAVLPLLDAGGTLVVANVRGGGEFGAPWWEAGRLKNKQNSWDDFVAVAQDLIRTKVTSPAHLAIKGESNGGLLTAVAATQRPDLFRAAIVGVPLTDMLRYTELLAGSSWVSEFGDPQDPEMAKVLLGYSPFHNIRSCVPYPEMFVTTSTADDRVHPGHARRFAARLRALGNPVLYYEQLQGGHGGAAVGTEAASLNALEAIYLMQKLGFGTLQRGESAATGK